MQELQQAPWLNHKMILLATVTISVKEYVDDKNVTYFDLDSTATVGIQGTTELRILDWIEKCREDHIIGNLKSRNHCVADLKTIQSGKGGNGLAPQAGLRMERKLEV